MLSTIPHVLLTPLLGTQIAIGVASASGSERILLVLGITTLIAGALCLVVLVAFVLDAVQRNASIPEQ